MSDKIAPGYSKIIKRKMALSNMKTKIYRSDYSSLEDFQEDIQLIVDNCRLFNRGTDAFIQVLHESLRICMEIVADTNLFFV